MNLHAGGMTKTTSAHKTLSVALLCIFIASGCATTYKPEELRRPSSISCIYLPTPMSFFTSRGIIHPTVETRLERGPYIAEMEDPEGTYYRAPPGGFSGWPYSLPSANTSNARDGGFWIPHDPKATPRLYSYFSTSAVPPEVPPADLNCSSFAQVKDPTTSKIDLIAFTAGGAIGGAAGGVIGRSMSPGSSVTYGTSAATGAAGGAIGVLIVGSIINADVGKIILYPWPENLEIDRLRGFAKQAIKINELPPRSILSTKSESNR